LHGKKFLAAVIIMAKKTTIVAEGFKPFIFEFDFPSSPPRLKDRLGTLQRLPEI